MTKELVATNGTFDQITAKKLCVEDICVSRDQLVALLAAAGQTSASGSWTQNASTSSTPAAPPSISINGSNPAHIQVGVRTTILLLSSPAPRTPTRISASTSTRRMPRARPRVRAWYLSKRRSMRALLQPRLLKPAVKLHLLRSRLHSTNSGVITKKHGNPCTLSPPAMPENVYPSIVSAKARANRTASAFASDLICSSVFGRVFIFLTVTSTTSFPPPTSCSDQVIFARTCSSSRGPISMSTPFATAALHLCRQLYHTSPRTFRAARTESTRTPPNP